MQDVPEAQDEYDSYVGGLYRLLVDGSSDDAIVDHLHSIELATTGLPRRDKSELVPVVQRLRDIDVRHHALAATIVFTDRLQWEAAVAGTFTEETFNAIVSDQTFNNGATLDFGAFTLTGTGNADVFDNMPTPDAPKNIVDAFPFGSPGSPNGTTYLKARVCEGADCETAFFTIDFADPQRAWGAEWGQVFPSSPSSFFISADGLPVGQAQPGFWGFVSSAPFSSVTIDTCAGCNGASTQIDNVVFSAVPEPATLALLCTAATAFAGYTMRRRRR